MSATLTSGSADTDVERHGELTLERYAFILAHTLHFSRDDLPEVLARLGVPAYEIRMADKPIVREGHAGGTWAWLGLPLPDSDGAEIRLALAVRLPDLQQEQLMLVERVVGLVSGTPVARQSSSSASLALPGEDAPAPGSPIAP